MHAAYKGNTEACNTLLENGADVNSNFQSDGVKRNLSLIPILNRLGNEAKHIVYASCDYRLPLSTLQYTPLMFATIAGNCPPSLSLHLFSILSLSPQFLSKYLHSLFFFHSPSQLGHANIVELLLQAGAKTNTTNNGGKTAVQLGAFIGESVVCVSVRTPMHVFQLVCVFLAGQHACVRTINNFFSMDDLQYYTKPHGLEKVPKLDPSLVSSLYPLMTTSNLHPVKVQRQVETNQANIKWNNSQPEKARFGSHNSNTLHDIPKAGIMMQTTIGHTSVGV